MPFQFRKEAIEEQLNSNFPSQGQGNPPLYYSLSEVVVPTYSINSTAEGSGLPENLQTAWDFSTGHVVTSNTTDTVIANTGFWKVQVNASLSSDGATSSVARLSITDGLSSKTIWETRITGGDTDRELTSSDSFIVFLKSGESLTQQSTYGNTFVNTSYRQIATVNGSLVNPLGFSFA